MRSRRFPLGTHPRASRLAAPAGKAAARFPRAPAARYPFLNLALLGLAAVTANPVVAPALPTPGLPSSREEVAAALTKVREEYGLDTVKLQSHLLQYTLEGGSVLASSVAVAGREDYRNKTFIVLTLDTGIVYNDSSDDPRSHAATIWRDIIEPTLRQFTTLEIPADGFELRVSYRHTSYKDRGDLFERLDEVPPPTEVLDLRLSCADILDLAGGRTTAEDVLKRSEPTLSGHPIAIDLGEPGKPAPAAIPPLFPDLPDQ